MPCASAPFDWSHQAQLTRRDQLADIFDRQYALRTRIARNAGFANYRDYAFRDLDRFDYTPADCEHLHAAIEEVVVPAMRRRYERRRDQMALDRLRPWDTGVNPLGRQPLRPFQDVATLIDGATGIFRQIDPTLGAYFRTMADERLLDLDNRKGKAPGGYCTILEHRGRPFIFMNAVGVGGDVQTLLHEAGHAFHGFEADALPFVWQRHTGQEMAEMAAMAMELAGRAVSRPRAGRVLFAGRSAPCPHRAVGDKPLPLPAHGRSRCLPALDLYQR